MGRDTSIPIAAIRIATAIRNPTNNNIAKATSKPISRVITAAATGTITTTMTPTTTAPITTAPTTMAPTTTEPTTTEPTTTVPTATAATVTATVRDTRLDIAMAAPTARMIAVPDAL